ncbi:phage portal protein [Peribacillus muralis]|uniref:phage portal protein n=1 Tax=Peribacillus muralis TaxID=264697 RepID=UPI00366D2497
MFNQSHVQGGLFEVGELYPSPLHVARIKRYRDNKKIVKGDSLEVLKKHYPELNETYRNTLFVGINLPGIIAKKSADFLFGESAIYSAGKKDNSPEQKVIDELVDRNELNILNYESALSNAYRGDSFYKVRYGQEFNGILPKEVDEFRVIIEAQNPEYVFPETLQGDANKVLAYHVAFPVQVQANSDDWILKVESHYPGFISYREYVVSPMIVNLDGEVEQFSIDAEIIERRKDIKTGVPHNLIIHVPNYATDDSWEGIDDISEHYALLAEISGRISQIKDILDKHSNPAMIVPMGTLDEDENGQPQFRVGIDKVFEVMDKTEVEPKYLVWNGQLENAFKALEKNIELLLSMSEIPLVALGAGDAGTSGSSGLSIKFRMSSMISKVNRKRQYYEKALKRVFLVAQKLDQVAKGVRKEALDYELSPIKIHFGDGLPNDELEQVTIYSTRLAGMPTISQKSAIMKLDGLSSEQADAEIERMKEEQEAAMESVDASVFNERSTNTSTNNSTGTDTNTNKDVV